jgi:molecular chaperone HtpG
MSTDTTESTQAPAAESKTETPAETSVAGAPASTDAHVVEMPFQAEVQKVLTLVIDSLYAHKEVFLRELVSNAADALDKARFFQLTHEDALRQEGEPRIEITSDETAGTLTITDNGIGMTRDEVIQNLGTIARSGSLEFLKANADKAKEKDAALNLIGQFGVGFYSAFMVATRVDVKTRSMKAGSTPVLWRSTGSGSFTVADGDREIPGTEIVLHLKEEHRDFVRTWRLKDIVTKYSDFVSFPIHVGGELANQSKALWTQPKNAVTEEQHQQFFKHLTQGTCGEKPLLTVHLSIDAPVQFHALLYVPSAQPFDLFQKERMSLRLYAKRVLIMENCEKLTPIWLRFLRGVVDSEDLSLNVSREMLQESRALAQIEQQIVKQVLKSLRDLAESDPAKYEELWRLFGKVLKEGLTLDFKNKDAIADLCRFESMKGTEGAPISLKAYVDAMPEGQRDIFYLTGLSRRAVETSPHLEAFRKKGYDVLFLTDPIDEWVVQSLTTYDKKKLQSVTHGDLDLGEEDKSEEFEGADPVAALGAIRDTLGDRVREVRFSKRLTDSASCLVSDAGDPGVNMERIMKMIDDRAQEKKRILEVNPKHAIVKNIAVLADRPEQRDRVAAFCEMLYDQALLAEGVVEDPAKLVRRIQDLLTQATTAAAGG